MALGPFDWLNAAAIFVYSYTAVSISVLSSRDHRVNIYESVKANKSTFILAGHGGQIQV